MPTNNCLQHCHCFITLQCSTCERLYKMIYGYIQITMHVRQNCNYYFNNNHIEDHNVIYKSWRKETSIVKNWFKMTFFSAQSLTASLTEKLLTGGPSIQWRIQDSGKGGCAGPRSGGYRGSGGMPPRNCFIFWML